MKTIAVFVLFTAVFALHAFPESRAFKHVNDAKLWMNDEDQEPVFVDVSSPVDSNTLNAKNGANNAYWLFTRRNRDNPQLLVHGDANSISNSFYNPNLPLKVLVHGWTGGLHSRMVPKIKGAFLDVADVNVILVDWNALAGENYITASFGVPSVGQYLGRFLTWLINTRGGNWNTMHLVGYSLGAHVVGFAGRQEGGRARRVTGLDPAGIMWNGNSDALNRYAGQYVEVIHTNTNLMGIKDANAHTDFYPNGGGFQPGCDTDKCSHSRAWDLYTSSIYTNHFVGRQCANLNQAFNNQCTGNRLSMGNGILNKNGNGIYGLLTGNSWPY
ncbi:unnamed protein product [Leptosia nina]|uniref:Lipase domain-containing protein n=1 Tax=Leptosia nina TaxID=320188 RepID=A0AAV1J4Z2_9NEOP